MYDVQFDELRYRSMSILFRNLVVSISNKMNFKAVTLGNRESRFFLENTILCLSVLFGVLNNVHAFDRIQFKK